MTGGCASSCVRASQLNGCAYCVDMHSKDSRAAGEIEQRLNALIVWRDTPFFTERERAALAFTDAVTLMNVDHVTNEAYEAVAEPTPRTRSLRSSA